MDRCAISQNLLTRVLDYYKNGESNSATRRWADKWKPILIKGKFYKDNKLLVPLEEVNDVLEKSATQGMPLSRDGAFYWLKEKYYGFKKRDVLKWINRLETVQLMRKKPFVNTRANKVHKKEGAAQVLILPQFEGRGCVGIDLCHIPQQSKTFPKETWTDSPYLYVATVQANNFTFAYPMKSKHATQARVCARKLWKDFRERYGFNVTGIVGDLGNEFKAQHFSFWKTKGITMRTVQKAWFVERRISILMRNIAALREGMNYEWEYSLKTALEKTNGTYCRKIKMIPSDVTGRQLKSGLTHYNRDLKRKPKQKRQPIYKVNQRCRVMTKNARDVNQILYKSYTNFRDKKLQTWTKTIFKIKKKKKKGYSYVYEVNNKWYYPWEIQIVTGPLIKLDAPAAAKKKAPPKRGVNLFTFWDKPKPKPKPKLKRKKKVRATMGKFAPIFLRQSSRLRRTGVIDLTL